MKAHIFFFLLGFFAAITPQCQARILTGKTSSKIFKIINHGAPKLLTNQEITEVIYQQFKEATKIKKDLSSNPPPMKSFAYTHEIPIGYSIIESTIWLYKRFILVITHHRSKTILPSIPLKTPQESSEQLEERDKNRTRALFNWFKAIEATRRRSPPPPPPPPPRAGLRPGQLEEDMSIPCVLGIGPCGSYITQISGDFGTPRRSPPPPPRRAPTPGQLRDDSPFGAIPKSPPPSPSHHQDSYIITNKNKETLQEQY